MRPPSFWNFDGSLQEVDELRDLFLRLVAAGDVGEGDGVVGLVEHARLALAEAERAALAAALHLAHEEDPDADQQQHREPRDEDLREEATAPPRACASTLTPYLMRSPTIQMSPGL